MAKTQQNILKELDSGKIFPLIVRLSVPAVIAQLITFLYNIVDRMYVAKIDKVGMDALAALGIVLPITLIIQAFANLIGLGGSPRAGIKMGEGNQAEANRIFNLSFLMLALIGVTIGLITFFFAEPIVLFFVQMTLQNVNVALGQARSALILAVTRKVIILIPLCFALTKYLGFQGVYLSEGIADFVAGIITSIVIFTSFPRIFRRRAEEVKNQKERFV